jgi:hypothetical protein
MMAGDGTGNPGPAAARAAGEAMRLAALAASASPSVVRAAAARGARRILPAPGRRPAEGDRRAPSGVRAQARRVWPNPTAPPAAAGTGPDNPAEMTARPADRSRRPAAAEIRNATRAEGRHAVGSIITGPVDPTRPTDIGGIAVA